LIIVGTVIYIYLCGRPPSIFTQDLATNFYQLLIDAGSKYEAASGCIMRRFERLLCNDRVHGKQAQGIPKRVFGKSTISVAVTCHGQNVTIGQRLVHKLRLVLDFPLWLNVRSISSRWRAACSSYSDSQQSALLLLSNRQPSPQRRGLGATHRSRWCWGYFLTIF
jgi:hypothetical protein